jgi:ABC-type dipeptide/oligopeptide/nickel transport system ATPase component
VSGDKRAADRRKARQPAVHELLRRARLDNPKQVATKFPHELSGGMAQRVVIALAIARKPSV